MMVAWAHVVCRNLKCLERRQQHGGGVPVELWAGQCRVWLHAHGGRGSRPLGRGEQLHVYIPSALLASGARRGRLPVGPAPGGTGPAYVLRLPVISFSYCFLG